MLPFLVTLHSFSEYRIQSRDSSNTVVTFLHSVVRFARLSYRGDTGILFKIAPRLNSSMFKNIFVLEGVLILHKKSECKSFAHFAQAKNPPEYRKAILMAKGLYLNSLVSIKSKNLAPLRKITKLFLKK